MPAHKPSDSSQQYQPIRLRGMDLSAMTTLLKDAGQPAYRGKQLMQWVYEKGARSFDEMTNLSKELRAWLNENATLGGLELKEVVGEKEETQKLVFQTEDGNFIESVLMRGEEEPDEDIPATPHIGSTLPQNRVSLCISSQIGCTLGCDFCMTGFGGFIRSLRIDEILDQVITARRLVSADERISNLVFMGMGEPMLNLSAVLPSIKLLTTPEAFGFATRRITVSTAGVIPGIRQFAEAATDVNLAVSLNATTQETRDRLMPGCKKWSLDDLMLTLRNFPLTKRRRITFEYVLLKGINDSKADLKRILYLVQGIPCKINLILFNRSDDLGYEPTDEYTGEEFRAALAASNLTASLRKSKGSRYEAACGQLAAHFKRKNNS